MVSLRELSDALRPMERIAMAPMLRVDSDLVDQKRLFLRQGPDSIGWDLVSKTELQCPVSCSFRRTPSLSTFYSSLGVPEAELHYDEALATEEDAQRIAQQLRELLESTIERVEVWSRGRLLKVSYLPDRHWIDGEPADFGTRLGIGLPFVAKTTKRMTYEPWLSRAEKP
jgi:hypothetical protein